MTKPPLSLTQPLDYDDAREGAKALARLRREALDSLQTAVEAAAESEAKYHKAKAKATARLSLNHGITEVQERVKGEVAAELLEREKDRYSVMIAQEKLATIDGERASFHRLVEWSTKLHNL